MSAYELTEVVPGIHRVVSPLGERTQAQYVCVGSERVLVVDTGTAGTVRDALGPALAQLSVPPTSVTDVLISHADVDHYGGNAELRALAPEARFAAHPADRPQIESFETIARERYGWYRAHGIDYPADTWTWLRDAAGRDTPLDDDATPGETLDLGGGLELDVLHLPGHSAGHLGLLHRGSGTLIALDGVMGDGFRSGTGDGELVNPTPYGDLAAYRATIAAVRALAPERLCTAHFPDRTGAAVGAFLDLTESFVARLDEAVLAAATDPRSPDGALSLADLLARCDAAVGPYSEATLELARSIAAHLDAHVAEGRARRVDGAGAPPRWALA